MNNADFSTQKRCLKTTALAAILAVASAGLVTASAIAAVTGVNGFTDSGKSQVVAALKLRLPKTPITSLGCEGFGGLCEVVSGKALFYIDERARYLFVGRLYDMETRADLTAAKLLAINPDLLAAGTASASQKINAGRPTANAAPQKVNLEGLPKNGAIFWGNPNGPKVIVFSDFQCSYCKRLTEELKKARVRVEERPISIFGAQSRAIAESVICAANKAVALHRAYAGGQTDGRSSCDTSGLDANEGFARRQGFSGTPVMVRASDGAVLQGYRSAPEIRTFLSASAAQGGAR
ncbi:MAG: DsbC family protein [Parasphingorhabdus sp.]|nr:DsbC family protein [Sphingorhabdus sp. YGSMI21]ATW03265.1 disulfide bond formation protein DsbC [Sphingorhabdus sp. YGSMI21]